MVYIPGPGMKNSPETIKKNKVEKKPETVAEEPKREKKRKKTVKVKREKTNKTSNKQFLLYLFIAISVFFSIAAFFKMYETEKAMRLRLDEMSAKYNAWYQEIKQKSEETYEILKPNGWLNQAVLSSSLIDNYIVGIDDIINVAQKGDFSDVAYCRIFVSGKSPVWISVEGNSKTFFGKNISPGLSDELFYYYKQPKVQIEGTTFIVPRNFKLTTGNYENTYLLFFNFGTTKLVKMNARSINNVPAAFDIWLPQN